MGANCTIKKWGERREQLHRRVTFQKHGSSETLLYSEKHNFANKKIVAKSTLQLSLPFFLRRMTIFVTNARVFFCLGQRLYYPLSL